MFGNGYTVLRKGEHDLRGGEDWEDFEGGVK